MSGVTGGEAIAGHTDLRRIGQGSAGVVYAARPPARLAAAGDSVALKVLTAPLAEDVFASVADALQDAASASSPHVVSLLEVGRHGDRTYLAMEHRQRGSLAEGHQSARQVIEAVASAARGADALHEVGLAHRNIKPSNILLGGAAAPGAGAVLCEPGLAHILAPGQTSSGVAALETMQYVEPGVLRGETPSRASDVWALAVTLHVALTGNPVYPGTGGDVMAALRQVMSGEVLIDDSLSGAVREIIERCLAADPQTRPETAAELAEALTSVASSGAAGDG